MSDKSVEGESLGFSLAAQLAWTDVDAPIAELNAPDQPALSPEMATLVSSLEPLEIVIDQETAALEAHQPVDLAEMNRPQEPQPAGAQPGAARPAGRRGFEPWRALDGHQGQAHAQLRGSGHASGCGARNYHQF